LAYSGQVASGRGQGSIAQSRREGDEGRTVSGVEARRRLPRSPAHEEETQRSPQRQQGAASHLLALRARMAHLLALRARMAHLLALRARMAHLLALRARMRFFRAGVICASALVPVLCTVYSVRALGARSNQFCPTSRALTSF